MSTDGPDPPANRPFGAILGSAAAETLGFPYAGSPDWLESVPTGTNREGCAGDDFEAVVGWPVGIEHIDGYPYL
ncbi:hypothetical protein A1Q2_02623 [Trichosporon asahii var. asahii CBS 8904]|uniref:Uncharacterized protein n=1 Tax=Trichosporon asahii var. asahii (strain CBS 8904) TaxID=1220162 RepID=K1WQ74_TRIAC|nr:hypothetical protein A1Q2_02623 [Trichosporon asahii var. asahii CBS 8904]